MRTKTILLLLPILFLFSCSGYYFNKAGKEFNQLSFSKAAMHYKKGLEKKDNIDARIRLADCYRLMNDVDLAEAQYEKIITDPRIPVSTYFYYAKILMEKGKYVQADEYFRIYLKSRPGDIVARLLLKSCNSITTYFADTTLWSLKKVTMPGVTSAFGGVAYGDGIIFTGDKEVTLDRNKSPWTGRSYMKLYFSKKDTTGHWLQPQLLMGDMNGQFHEGPASFSADGQLAYFTRSNCVKNKMVSSTMGENNLKIYRAELVNGKWIHVTELPFNSNEYSAGHPSLSADGKTLFFISDMPGGYGGTDIYKVSIEGLTCSKPENLGPRVNSVGNEMFPYYDEDGSLYFSSDGRNTMGGLDVFVTSWDGSRWLKPENLNAPLNSAADDFAFIPDKKDKTKALVSSNRSGTDALYEVKKNAPTFHVIVMVREKANAHPIKDATIELMNWGTRKKESYTTDMNGNVKALLTAETEFTLLAAKDGFFAQTSELSTKGKKYSETLYAEFELTALVIDRPIVLENIYYDLDKWEIRPDAATELDKLVKVLVDNPSISIEMGSHTDSRASYAYNMVLSDKRAEAAVNYLISRGISADRLKWKGYGFTQLVNKCKKGVECTEAEHQKNRRTEFKVLHINPSAWNPVRNTKTEEPSAPPGTL
ncbi:MAG: OmpA family protein [Bacteroidia bacterium]